MKSLAVPKRHGYLLDVACGFLQRICFRQFQKRHGYLDSIILRRNGAGRSNERSSSSTSESAWRFERGWWSMKAKRES